MEKDNYYVGLDIGTDSIGWAVTDENYNLVKAHGKQLWGIRLFDEANTAQERRMKRTNRRRGERKRQRIQLLQEIFDEEIGKVDENFFARLEESKFFEEDKKKSKSKYGVFSDKDYTDVDYFKEYPTIYHLRKELMFDKEPHDVRLVYLAIHNIVKHRGHFLFEGDLKNATDFESIFRNFIDHISDEYGQEIINVEAKAVEELLRSKDKNKSAKKRELQNMFLVEKDNKAFQAILGLMVGLKGDLKNLFPEDTAIAEMEKTSFSFSDASYEEFRQELEERMPEHIYLIDMIKSVYDWTILSEILQGGEYEGQSYLSVAKTRLYDKHKEDLQLLKQIVRKYMPEEYKRTFYPCKGENNYAAYIGEKGVKRCNREDFYKFLECILNKLPEDEEAIQIISKDIQKNTFLPLLVTKDNGVIPYQVHKAELRKILDMAQNYLSFLKQQTAEGVTNREKIEMLFEFRIPYYVGPLNDSHKKESGHCWIVKKDLASSIRPWNFSEKVNEDASAEQFIERMTAKCSYLAGEDVLPKNSLLYSEFMVLNELNNLRIKGGKPSIELKQNIYRDLFQKRARVTGKMLLDYLKAEGYEVTHEDLSGFDKDFKASLASYLDFQKKVFKGEEEKMEQYAVREMIEKIIKWICVYGDEKKMLKRVVEREYGKVFSQAQIQAICNLKYNGWGRLSAAFLKEVEGADCETGEVFSIIGALRNTNDNLMQILSQKYTFLKAITEINAKKQNVMQGISYDNLIRDMYVSPAVKRSIWQTILVLQEIKKLMGAEPARIFIEMARGDKEAKKGEAGRTSSRKNQLLALYQNIQDESRDWKEELESTPESDFRSIKLYLYYTQKGRCMYSGEHIDLKDLADVNIYDKDHIYPQSKTKDDSLNNLVLVKKTINATKGNDIISPDIQKKMRPFWTELLRENLITKEKFYRLTRNTPLTEDELAGFIGRQLVETRQSTKAVAELLGKLYTQSKIVYVKALLADDFKKENNILKCRMLNDYHHARDAYLNIVVGNVYFTKFTDNPIKWLKDNRDKKYSLNKMFDYDLFEREKCVWKRGKKGTLQTVLATLKKNNILYTRYALCNKGELFNAQIVGRDENPTVPIKKGMDVKKYGGYKGITSAYFALVESLDKKGNAIRSIEAVPLYLEKEISKNEEVFLQYCGDVYRLKQPRIVIRKIKKNALIKINGFPMHLRGTTGKQLSLQGAVQLCVDEEEAAYIKKIEKYIERNMKRVNKRENLPIHEKYDKLSKDQNVKLFEKLLQKQEQSIYRFRPASQIQKLHEGEEVFKKLNLEEQTICLAEILKLFSCKPITVNLALIGGASKAGNMQVSKVISSFDSAYLLHQSVTGIYQQEIDLLKV